MPAVPVPLPASLQRAALRRGVALLNHMLDDAARARLAPHAGKRAELRAGGMRVELEVDAQGAFMLPEALPAAAPGAPPAVRPAVPPEVSSKPLPELPAAAAPALRVDADLRELLAARLRGETVGGVHIAGDAEFAQAMSWALQHLQLDVEDELAPWLGDIAAHRLGRAAHDARTRGAALGRRALDDARAWLAQSPRLLVARAEFDATAAAVARVRDAAARLDKRIALLQRRRG
jgi:ubiquinone biosynthesis protein UbiJ